jgi:hypothetical protein
VSGERARSLSCYEARVRSHARTDGCTSDGDSSTVFIGFDAPSGCRALSGSRRGLRRSRYHRGSSRCTVRRAPPRPQSRRSRASSVHGSGVFGSYMGKRAIVSGESGGCRSRGSREENPEARRFASQLLTSLASSRHPVRRPRSESPRATVLPVTREVGRRRTSRLGPRSVRPTCGHDVAR